MEVSDAMILLAVDGSSLFLAHKADLQMRSQAVLRIPRKTDILWNVILWNGNSVKQRAFPFLSGPGSSGASSSTELFCFPRMWLPLLT